MCKDLPKKGAREYQVVVATYTCGHTADFRGSAPKEQEVNTCLVCFKEVRVTSTEVEVRVHPGDRNSGGSFLEE